jgi:hypothetical protein
LDQTKHGLIHEGDDDDDDDDEIKNTVLYRVVPLLCNNREKEYALLGNG